MTWTPGDPIGSWPQAEELAAHHMSDVLGFLDVELTRRGSDGGLDVISRSAVAQVKRELKQVGRPLLQQLRGSRGRNDDRQPIFYAASGYTEPATDYAYWNLVALFTFDDSGTIRSANEWATSLERSAQDRASRASRHAGRRPHRGRLTAFAFLVLHPVMLLVLDVLGGDPVGVIEWLAAAASATAFCFLVVDFPRLSKRIAATPDDPGLNGPFARLFWPERETPEVEPPVLTDRDLLSSRVAANVLPSARDL